MSFTSNRSDITTRPGQSLSQASKGEGIHTVTKNTRNRAVTPSADAPVHASESERVNAALGQFRVEHVLVHVVYARVCLRKYKDITSPLCT